MGALHITVEQGTGETWPVVMTYDRPGGLLPGRAEGALQIARLELQRAEVGLDARQYGTLLGRALFREDLRDAFVRARAENPDRLRVLLEVRDAALTSLRWERLCAPLDGGWHFLALDQRLPFCLYLPGRVERRFQPIGRTDLRALVLVASPDGGERWPALVPFDVSATVAGLRTALDAIPSDVLAAVDGAAGPPTLDALCERLTVDFYPLLHVVCHGQFQRGSSDPSQDGRGETVLYLADASGKPESVTATRLIDRLRTIQGPRGLPHFAFLAACESASAEAEAAMGGLAQRLVRELEMPAVIAMTERVSVATARALAEGFYRRLYEHGEVDRALVESGAALAGRRDIMVPALFSRLGGRPLFSDTPDRPLTPKETAIGLARLQDLVEQRAPVLQGELARLAEPVHRTVQTNPDALSPIAREQRTRALGALDALCLEVVEIRFGALALGEEPPAYDGRCPSPGLYAFGLRDAAGEDFARFFSGRTAVIRKLLEGLREHPFLPVLGPSGSGKSSLVLAGLVPALQVAEAGLQLAYLRPGTDPPAQLDNALARLGDGPAVIVVDQFEEFFTTCTDEARRRAFLDRLLPLATQRRVVITMRSDFLGDCTAYPALQEVVEKHLVLVGPMTPAELGDALRQQVEKVGLQFDPGLVETLLSDVRDEPGAMPLLQHTLRELWVRRHGRWLRTEEYQALGPESEDERRANPALSGVRGALANTADRVYEDLELSDEDRDRIRAIFVRLTRLGEDGAGDPERRDTRRRVETDELVPVGGDAAATIRLVQRLADARLVVTTVNPVTQRDEVEVAHEALIRYWPRLRRWLDEGRAMLRLRESIREAAHEWESRSKDESLLVHRGSRLAEAEALLDRPRFALNRREQAYVDACIALRERARAEEEAQRRREVEAARRLAEQAEARRRAEEAAREEAEARLEAEGAARKLADERLRVEQRARRRLLYGALALALALAVAAGAAVIAARKQREAQLQATISLSGQLAAQALNVLDDKPDVALLLSRAAYRIHPSAQARDSLLASLTHNPFLKTILHDHRAAVASVAFSPDGRLLATGDKAGVLIVGSATAPRTPRLSLPAQPAGITSLAFAVDGRTLAAASADEIRLWNTETGDPVGKPLAGQSGAVLCLAFSPDHEVLASGHADGSVILWDVSNGRPLDIGSYATRRAVRSIAFSPDGHVLAAGGEGAAIRLWDIDGSQLRPRGTELVPKRLGGSRPPVMSLAFRPGTQTLAVGMGAFNIFDENAIDLWDISVDPPVSSSIGSVEGAVTGVAFSANGALLATGGADRAVRLWDAERRQIIGEPLRVHGDQVLAVAFGRHDSETTFASAGADTAVVLWDARGGQGIFTGVQEQGGKVDRLALSSDGTLLATGGSRSPIKLWDMDTHAPLFPLDLPAMPGPLGGPLLDVYGLAFAPGADGGRSGPRLLASGDVRADSRVMLWNLETRRPDGQPLTTSGHDTQVLRVVFSPDGTWVASVSRDRILVWDAASRRKLPPLSGPWRNGWGLAFSPDSATLASSTVDGRILLWDVASLEGDHATPKRTIEGHDAEVISIAFADAARMASAGRDGTIRLWNLASGAGPQTFGDHTQEVWSVAFNKDHTRMASGDATGSVILWAVDWRADLAVVTRIGPPVLAHQGYVPDVAFGASGRTLVTAGEDGTIKWWDLDEAGWLRRACEIANRDLTDEEWRQYVSSDLRSRMKVCST